MVFIFIINIGIKATKLDTKFIIDIYLKNNSGYIFNNEERLSNYEEYILDYNSVSNFFAGDYDPMLQKVLQVLITP